MSLSVRFLLTNNCSAHCGYCHNEGQEVGKKFLSLSMIEEFLNNLHKNGNTPSEIILSGGEPTLHPMVGEIASFCKKHCAFVSMDTHGGHPKRLIKALPYLSELKLHIDSFDAEEQMTSMGINIKKSLESIDLAKNFPLNLLVNHPLRDAEKTISFVKRAREIGVNCKIIELFGNDSVMVPLAEIYLENMGYINQDTGHWLHSEDNHHIFTKRCGSKYNLSETYFVGVDGVRRYLN